MSFGAQLPVSLLPAGAITALGMDPNEKLAFEGTVGITFGRLIASGSTWMAPEEIPQDGALRQLLDVLGMEGSNLIIEVSLGGSLGLVTGGGGGGLDALKDLRRQFQETTHGSAPQSHIARSKGVLDHGAMIMPLKSGARRLNWLTLNV